MLIPSTPDRLQELCAFQFALGIGAARRNDFHHGDKLPGGDLAAQIRALAQRRRFDRFGLGRPYRVL